MERQAETTAQADASIALVQRFFALMIAKEIEEWGELWHEDARILIYYPPPGFPPAIEGKAAILAGFRELFSHFAKYRANIRDIYRTTDPNVVIVEWGVEASLTTGDIYRGDNITVFKIRAGRITEYHDYFNPTAFAVVVAALERPK